jgi:cellobiose phosphorylase
VATATTAGRRVGVNPYGWYDVAAREYVITRPDTPTPWLNYLGEGRYGGIVSNTGGGFSFDRDPRDRRVSRYRYNSLPADQPGRYVYLRDEESGAYWSVTWQPVRGALHAYECRHGTGYTRIATGRDEIAAELLYFVPPELADGPWPCELWVLRVRNESGRPRLLRAFSYVELGYLDAVVDQQNLDWAQHIVRSSFVDGAILTGTVFRPDTTFFASDAAPLGFDSDREAFVGRCRDLANPLVVERGEPTGSEAARGNSIGSLCHELALDPGEERRVVYILGLADTPAGVERVLSAFRDPTAVERAFAVLRTDWDAYLSHFTVETPDPELDAMVNVWNQVQCRTTLHWSRFVSGYDTGLGRGMGTRDSAQDTLGTVHAVPGYARAFDDAGAPLGVASEPARRIDMNPQTWSVIGEVASRERAGRAMDSLHEELATEFGIALLDPPYSGGDERVRGTSTYPPGAKENGGIFCHANAWAIVAAAALGDGDRALDYYRRILPLSRTDSDRYLVEPYVYCQNVCGPTHPQFGLGRNAWLTGTAAWAYVAATQWLLGIRPTYRGLRIAPALPSSWNGFRARRRFRDAVYVIEVERAGTGSTVSLVVDGEPVAGDVVPLPDGRDRVVVRATVG